MIVFIAVCAGISGLWIVLLFNRLVRLRNQQKEGWSGIEIQLKRRHDLVPRLVTVVRGYTEHEKKTLEATAQARTHAASHLNPEESPAAESGLSQHLGTLIALAENYPNLKAAGNFQQLFRELVNIENDIQFARRFYNGAVRDFRNATMIFPNNLIAGPMGFQPAPFFELSCTTEAINPGVKLP
jgi:LemA protein